jgi:hypothetical protein
MLPSLPLESLSSGEQQMGVMLDVIAEFGVPELSLFVREISWLMGDMLGSLQLAMLSNPSCREKC